MRRFGTVVVVGAVLALAACGDDGGTTSSSTGTTTSTVPATSAPVVTSSTVATGTSISAPPTTRPGAAATRIGYEHAPVVGDTPLGPGLTQRGGWVIGEPGASGRYEHAGVLAVAGDREELWLERVVARSASGDPARWRVVAAVDVPPHGRDLGVQGTDCGRPAVSPNDNRVTALVRSDRAAPFATAVAAWLLDPDRETIESIDPATVRCATLGDD